MSRIGRIAASLAVAGMVAVLPATGRAAVAYNGMTVLPDPEHAGVFEVLRYPMAGPIDYWCAAGDFVVNRMHKPQNTRIYIANGRAPSRLVRGRSAVTFTIVPYGDIAGLAGQDFGYSLSISKRGYNFLAGGGRGLCVQSRRRLMHWGF
ncbi:hypothetical protein [Tropicimonas sp.]|uniref:hypothetical protein n=1 Tax=Tropicimonas sp. TaxID=2067044 RepID=UPI003A882B2C